MKNSNEETNGTKQVNPVKKESSNGANGAKEAPAAKEPSGTGFNIAKLKKMTIQELTKAAKDLNINSISGLKKQDLIFKILQ
ncbi:MAG: Rho termination factor N-terminal domain-containing protein, partial [Candidatus Omnitrophota bacterium]|nr:Rho termination factor N-terminal domain-containing protein [Candidatus Omnitrophota bacterium]